MIVITPPLLADYSSDYSNKPAFSKNPHRKISYFKPTHDQTASERRNAIEDADD